MHTSSRCVVPAFLALLAALPVAADAQIGGFIRKKVEQKVADKVQARANRPTPPKFDDQVLEITSDRLGQLLRGVEAEVATASSAGQAAATARQQGSAGQAAFDAEMKTYRVRQHEFETSHAKWIHCTQAAMQPAMQAAAQNPAMTQMMQRLAALPEADREAFEARVEARQEKMAAAERRGDDAEKMRLYDEMDADMKRTAGVSFADIQAAGTASGQMAAGGHANAAACGPQPVAPLAPEPPAGAAVVNVRDSVRTAAAQASGLTAAQYAILRERVAAWLAHEEDGRDLMQYGFTDDELEALGGRRAALKARREALLAQDGPAGWTF